MDGETPTQCDTNLKEKEGKRKKKRKKREGRREKKEEEAEGMDCVQKQHQQVKSLMVNWYNGVKRKKKNNKICHGPLPAFNSVREGPLGTISTTSNKRTQPCRTKVA